jgi:2,4-dienoyl-CoA reductase (NADPH2)
VGGDSDDGDGSLDEDDVVVVVWDPVGGPIGVSVAELAARHSATSLVTPDHTAGTQLTRSGDLVDANTRLQEAGVEIVRRAVLRRAGAGEIEIEDRFGGGTSTRPASLLVDAGQRLPSEPLSAAPEGMRVAGDAVAPRTVHEAVLEGRRAAFALAS